MYYNILYRCIWLSYKVLSYAKVHAQLSIHQSKVNSFLALLVHSTCNNIFFVYISSCSTCTIAQLYKANLWTIEYVHPIGQHIGLSIDTHRISVTTETLFTVVLAYTQYQAINKISNGFQDKYCL